MEIGELLAGKYRVERVLGRGGQGEVVQATNLLLGQSVAMKFLLPEMARDPVLVQRFLREARSAAQLKSEHVARVLDVDTLDNASPYIVFEYLEGTDLTQFPRDKFSLAVGIDFALQASEALPEAHSKGIVHRDIKPANLFITTASDGTPSLKVLDFGISKVEDASVPNLTAAYTMMGTPRYSSPEQLMSTATADHRTDIWSLGVVLYELVEGHVPYDADTLTQLALKVMTTPLPPLTAQIPVPLAAAISRCLEKDPARRFQSMGELARALVPFASSPAQAAMLVQRATRNSSPSIEGVTAVAPPPIAPATPSAPRGGRRWLVAILAGAVVGGAIALFAGYGRARAKPAQTTEVEMHQMPVEAPADASVLAVAQVEPEASADAALARDDRAEWAKQRVTGALVAFVAWTAEHPADACPTIDALGSDIEHQDPWGTPLVVTCTDQPDDQIAGIISAGPDRETGTADDVRSWELAPDLVASAKGPRWLAKPTTAHEDAHPKITKKKSGTGKSGKSGTGTKATTTGKTSGVVDRDGDGIPDVR